MSSVAIRAPHSFFFRQPLTGKITLVGVWRLVPQLLEDLKRGVAFVGTKKHLRFVEKASRSVALEVALPKVLCDYRFSRVSCSINAPELDPLQDPVRWLAFERLRYWRDSFGRRVL